MGKWISISKHEDEHCCSTRLFPMGSGEEFASLTCPGHAPCVFCARHYSMWCHCWERKNYEFQYGKSQCFILFPSKMDDEQSADFHKTSPFLMDTSSWRTNLFSWFFWPSLLSFLSLANQGAGSSLSLRVASLTSKHFEALSFTFFQFFWRLLTCKHQNSHPCVKVLIGLWPERSLTRNW